MNYDFLHAVNMRKWNRNMLNAYWFMTIASILVELSYLFFANPDVRTYLHQYLYKPSAIIICILIVTEIFNTWTARFNEYLIIISGAAIVTALLFVHSGIPALYNALFLPILISAFYFQVKKVLFSFCVMFLDCVFLFYVQSELGNPPSPGDFISTLSILISGTVICVGIMHRGIELLGQLKSTLETKEELLVKNIIMDRLSKIDPLTELYNHITFHEYLDRLTEQSDTFDLPLQMVVLDIDNFKKINDMFGHRAGDAVLKRVAAILHAVVKPNDFVARYGGEEFAILFTEKTLQESKEIMENIRTRIADTPNPELEKHTVTISGGLIEYQRGSGKEQFFRLADEALYVAKKSGKNRIVIH